jgi:uncharacterized phage protein gp47/JayE
MPDLPTRDDLFNVGANEVLSRAQARTTGRQITEDQIFLDGSDANLLLASSSVMGEEVVRQTSEALNNLTLDGASGEALDRWVADRYSSSVVRKEASPSRGSLTFTRSSTAAGAVNYESGSIVQTEGGTRFELLQTASFSGSSLGPITVNGIAVNAGIGGNVPAGSITRAVTAFPDSTMAVTNSESFSGGDDTETDASFRNRARLFFPQASRGILDAIEFGALTVSGVRQATAEEVLNSDSWPTGFINLFIADVNGQANSQLIELVRIALLEYRSAGNPADIFGAIPVYESISLNLSYQTNVDTLAAFEQIQDTLIAQISQLAPNSILERSLIFAACRSVTGVIVADDAVVTPVGDVVPSQGQIIRTRKDLITSV